MVSLAPTEELSALDSRDAWFDPRLVIAEVDAVWVGRFVEIGDVGTVERIDSSIPKLITLHCSVLIDDSLH